MPRARLSKVHIARFHRHGRSNNGPETCADGAIRQNKGWALGSIIACIETARLSRDAKLAGQQADIMHHQQKGFVCRAAIVMRRDASRLCQYPIV